MAKVNFNVPLKRLNGESILEAGKEIMIGEFLANGLVNQKATDKAMQTFELATKIYKAKGEIELAQSEKDIILRYLENSETLISVLAAAQILSIVKK